MIGLEKEIEHRKKSIVSKNHEPISYTNIARIIGKTYKTAQYKTKNASFTVSEAIKIYDELGFKTKNKFDALKYLFTEQDKI